MPGLLADETNGIREHPSFFSAMLAGARLDSWDEHFDWQLWQQAFEDSGIDPAFYASRQRSYSEILPWDHLSCGVDKEYLWKEYLNALEAAVTVDCRQNNCTFCGACPNLQAEVLLTKGE